jgi:hypothetical protein
LHLGCSEIAESGIDFQFAAVLAGKAAADAPMPGFILVRTKIQTDLPKAGCAMWQTARLISVKATTKHCK